MRDAACNASCLLALRPRKMQLLRNLVCPIARQVASERLPALVTLATLLLFKSKDLRKIRNYISCSNIKHSLDCIRPYIGHLYQVLNLPYYK